MEVTPSDHPDRAARLASLGNALEKRFERGGELPDPEEVIRLLREAVEVTPPDHPDRAARLASLAIALASRASDSRAVP